MNEPLQIKRLNHSILRILRNSWIAILVITIIFYILVFNTTAKAMKNQMDFWLEFFELKLDNTEGVIDGNADVSGVNRIDVDPQGEIIRSDDSNLLSINIQNSAIHRRMTQLDLYQIQVFFHPDLYSGKNSLYFVKKLEDRYSMLIFEPGDFFAESTSTMVFQIKSSNVVLYSSKPHQVGHIGETPPISFENWRPLISREQALQRTDSLNIVLYADISGQFYSLSIILLLLVLSLLYLIGSSRRVEHKMRILSEEQVELLNLLRNLSQRENAERASSTVEISRVLAGFDSIGKKTAQHLFNFQEHQEYLSVLNSFVQDIVLLLGRVLDDSKKIKRMESLLLNVINSMPSLLISLDSDFKVTQWNHRAEAMTSITASQAINRSLEEVFPRLANWSEHISESLESRQEIVLTQQKRVEEGRTIFEDITIFPLIANGIQGVVIRVDDITERVKLQEDLLQSQKMDAIGQLAGGIAHDFNNMLGGIIGAVDYLGPYCSDNEDAKDFINIIMEASERAAGLARDLLAFARKRPIGSTPVDLHSIIQSSLNILEKTLDKAITIEHSLKAAEYWVVGEETQLQNIFMNLAINASHAMPHGGSLLFSTENITLTSMDCRNSTFDLIPGNYISIVVQDSGTGMTEEVKKRIFEPFFTTKQTGKGTGIGLAAVYGTIQRHGGSISVYSEVEKGSSFHIQIPVSEKSHSNTDDKRSDIQMGQGTILLVDDESIMLKTGAALLREMGYDVLTAENGNDAIEMVTQRRNDLDLVILDMVMPGINGRTCIRMIRQMGVNTPVILSSGFTRSEELNEMEEYKPDGFISKPYRASELSRRVSDVLRNNSPK